MFSILPLFRAVRSARIPLPAKVLISYLLVLTVGALPTYYFLRSVFITEFMTDAVKRVASHAQLLANFLGDLHSVDARIAELQHLTPTLAERVTYIGASGRVLFDSTTTDLHQVDNHFGRPEIARALGKLPADDSFDIKLPPNVGISKRPGEVTHDETLYVAVRIVDSTGDGSDCVRLAIPILELQRLSTLITRVIRNSQAAAVSLAILLSLVAAVVFLRPLQRITRMAESLADGDYTARAGPYGNDEIGDVGHALEQLSGELRRRLAVAQAGEAMLVQLVHGVHLPMAIFDPDGRVIAINGAAREAFSRVQSLAEENFQNFIKSAEFTDAMRDAQTRGEPVPLRYNAVDGHVAGWVHVLNHPASPPFCAFLGEEVVRRPLFRLPARSELQATAISSAFAAAQERAAMVLQQRGTHFILEGSMPEVALCDINEHLITGIMLALCGAVPSGSGAVQLHFVDKGPRVHLQIAAPVTDAAVVAIGNLLHPIGGRIKTTAERSVLLLAKA